jgi:hypothetical protein
MANSLRCMDQFRSIGTFITNAAAGPPEPADTLSNQLFSGSAAGQNRGRVGSAAQFIAGYSQYLSHVDNASLSTGDIDFTLAAWVGCIRDYWPWGRTCVCALSRRSHASGPTRWSAPTTCAPFLQVSPSTNERCKPWVG